MNDIEDIYGRVADFSMQFTPEKKPFLSLVLDSSERIFPFRQDIQAKIYSLSPEKTEYSVKACRLSFEDFMQASSLFQTKQKSVYDALYAILDSDRTSLCVKKNIVLSPDGNVTHFSLAELYGDAKMLPGFYMMAFRDKNEILPYESFVAPKLFSVVDVNAMMKVDTNGNFHISALDIATGKPLANQEVRVFENAFPNPVVPDFLATGSGKVVGKTDSGGQLRVPENAVFS